MTFFSPRLAALLFPLMLASSISRGGPTRVANTSLNLPANLPGGTFSTTDAFPGLLFTDPVALATPPGESNRLFVVEQTGRIAVIPDLSNPTKEIFLDIRSIVRSSGNEEGLLGLAFHPNYNNAGEQGFGEFFVYYQVNVANQRHWRLSRFSRDAGNPNRGDAASEVPMITQWDQAGNHNGGDLHFGDDGYLYVSVGDEGGANDAYDNGQHIDKDFFAAILRLDVDQLEENLVPNTHSAVHAGSYRIPADNPFVGATTFNGSAITPSDIRTEIWATGLRNPWRMSFDRDTNRLFVADVGQGAREEINILSPSVFANNGGIPNYGWSFREGFQAFTNGPGGATPPPGFSAIDPIHDYPRTEGRSVTGGLVYRGSQYAELTGDYIFGDYITGRIWAMDDPGGSSQAVTQITTITQIAGFGIHPGTGHILLAKDNSNRANDDRILRLLRTPQSGPQPPQFLSQTGAFSNLAALTPEAGILPYEVNLPFWSDHAEKFRWFSIPSISDKMDWAEDANWAFPTGQVWIKHFDLELNRDNPGSNRKRIETRFLVKTEDDVYGITYRWNAAQTDAELVEENGMTEDFTVTENGQVRTQTWTYPGRGDCRSCHNAAAGGALSFTTRQINRDFDYGSGPEDQLDALEAAGYFTNSVPQSSGLPRFSAPDDESHTLEHRARSFLSTNCISCHQPGGGALGYWNARPEFTLEASGILESPINNNGGDPFARTIVPGDPARSMILQRLHAVGNPISLAPMPPLGTTEVNAEGISLLTSWINSLPKILFVRGADRSGGFYEGTNDTQRTEHLADINNNTTGSGNHGWGELAATLRNKGFIVEQITETAETSSGASSGIHIDFENLNLDQYRIIVFGSNNAAYDTAAIDAIDNYVRDGGSALFISDANFGGDWADAANSDQQFLDRFGLVMNQDHGTYAKTRSAGEFIDPNHPIFDSVDEFHGEGVSPISLGTLPPDVSAMVLASAEGNVRRNSPPFGGDNQGSTTTATAQDGALVIATAGDGKIAGHYDRNTFFNQGGVGSDITRFDNHQYAINLFEWLASSTETSAPPPTGLTASDGEFTDRVDLSWEAVSGASLYTVYRGQSNVFSAATELTTTTSTSFSDASATTAVDYFYWVSATIESLDSSPSNPDSGFRGVVAPTGLTASDGTSTEEISLSWSPVSSASYQIFRSTINSSATASLIGTSLTNSFLDSDNSHEPERPYFFWAVAISNGKSSALSSSDSGHRNFGQVAGVTASGNTSSDGISLSWDALFGATQYQVYRGTSETFEGATLLTTSPTNSHFDSTATPETVYFYWIVAENNYGSAPVSASASGERLLEIIQPDLLIGRQSSALIGNDIYNLVGPQRVRRVVRRRRKATAYFLYENDGTKLDTIRIAATRSNSAFRLSYLRLLPTAQNISSQVFIGSYLRELTPTQSELARVQVRPRRSVKRRARTRKQIVIVRAFSTNDNAKQDRAQFDAVSKK